MSWVLLLLHAGLLAGGALLLEGVTGRWREGAAVQQPWRDLVRLWRKRGVAPAGASFVFQGAPAVSLGAMVVAGVLVPSFALGMPTAAGADLVVVVGLLLLSRGAWALAGYDAGAGAVFSGQRAMARGMGGVSVLMLVALAVVLLAGVANVDAGAAAVHDGGLGARLAGVLAGAAVFGVLLRERAAIGAYGGKARAVALGSAWLGRVVVLSLVADLALPFGLAPTRGGVVAGMVGVGCWVLKIGVLGGVAVLVGPARLALPVTLAASASAAVVAVVVASAQGAA